MTPPAEPVRETVTRYRFPVAPGIITEVVFVGGPPTRRAIATTIETLLLMERALMEPEPDGPAPEAADRRCENAGCGSGAWLTDDWECPECGWRPV
jgi:hypothetical protein